MSDQDGKLKEIKAGENLQAHWDSAGNVYQFTLHIRLGPYEGFIEGYVANVDNRIRIVSVNQAEIKDLIPILSYIASREQWYCQEVRKAGDAFALEQATAQIANASKPI